MAMKSSDVPSRILSFRVKAILSSVEDVDRQYRMAHEYQNDLVRVELEKRKTYRACRSSLPEYAKVERPYLELEGQLEAVRAEINRLEQAARQRVDTPELDARAAEILGKLKRQQILKDAAAKSVKSDPVLVAVARQADEVAEASIVAIRDDYSQRGLAWGTRGLADQAMQAARKAKMDPKIHRWEGRGRIGVQLQGKNLSSDLKASGRQIAADQKRLKALKMELGKDSAVVKELAERLLKAKQERYMQKSPENRGLPVGGLATDTRLQIVVPPEISYQAKSMRRGDRRRAARTTMKMRIGSTPQGEPLWAEFAVTMHRQLPAEGVIKWAWIKKSMLGMHERYHLQMVVEAPSFLQKVSVATRIEAVAIDFGWLVRDKNVLRVAYLLDTAGNRREVLMPSSVVERLKHADSLRCIEDLEFNKIKGRFLEWISINKETCPPWFQDTFQFLPQSRSPKNLAWNVREWRNRRFSGDSLIYDDLVAWRKQFLHLYEWEVNERAGALAERKNFYWCLVLELAKMYHNVVLEDFNMTKMVKNSMPEEEDDNPQTQRHNRHMSSISELRTCLASTCAAWGSQIWLRPAAYTTLDCHACHSSGDKHAQWDTAVERIHTCQEKCGETWDQDFNAAANLLFGWLKARKLSRAA